MYIFVIIATLQLKMYVEPDVCFVNTCRRLIDLSLIAGTADQYAPSGASSAYTAF